MKLQNSLMILIILAVSLILATAASAVVIGQTDNFEDGTTQNWVVNLLGLGIHPAPPINIANGGPLGIGDNYLKLTSVGGTGAGSRLTVINVNQWTGDYTTAGVTEIAMDLNNLGSTDLSIRLYLENPTVGPPIDTAVSGPVLLPAGSGWRHVVFAIAPFSLTTLSGNVNNLLDNVTALRIFHSPSAAFPGPAVTAVLGVDSITAQAAPVGPIRLINSMVTFNPISSSYKSTSNASGCPAGYAGKFSFDARLTNISRTQLYDLTVKVATLTNNNLLQNADGGPGIAGTVMTVPEKNGYSDGILTLNEFVDVPFIICLKQMKSFSFFVDVLGIPGYVIDWANLQWPPSITHTISAINRTDNAYGQVWIDGVTNLPGAAEGLRAQLGFGTVGSNPADNPNWVWVDASFNVNAGNNDEFVASMLPDAVGQYDYVYRYSTTNGLSWLYADLNGPVAGGALPSNPGKLTVNSSGDVVPPATPANLNVVSFSKSSIEIAWDPVIGDPTLYGYEVLRAAAAGGPYTFIALVSGASNYIDTNVQTGTPYFYVVRAVDLSFNRSGNSNEVQGTPQLRTVTVTFNVTVPASTDATGRSVYIAGTLNLLDGNLPQWDPGGVVLTRLDATHWTITLTGDEGTAIEYKYTLGDFDHVEKGGSCEELANRQLTLSYGSNGTQTVNDLVMNWRNVSPCGN